MACKPSLAVLLLEGGGVTAPFGSLLWSPGLLLWPTTHGVATAHEAPHLHFSLSEDPPVALPVHYLGSTFTDFMLIYLLLFGFGLDSAVSPAPVKLAYPRVAKPALYEEQVD